MKTLIFFLISAISFGQQLTGEELLDKAIAHHDPNSNWSSFNNTLNITMETPKSPSRDSEIIINLPEEYFYIKAKRDSLTTEYVLNKASCIIKLNGESNLSEKVMETHKLSCERANLFKNYYTYLYGLPMKLKDEGTIVNPKVKKKTFKGKEYWVLNVSYDESVGSDIWNFYFDPETFAMEVYQFFKTDDKGNLKKDSGEYILLSETRVINDIKIPKIRKWYYNKDDGYLGTDILRD